MKHRLIFTSILMIVFLGATRLASVCYAADCYAFETAKGESPDSFKLLGTILESNPGNSFAVIKDSDSERQGIYKIGNKVLGYQIAKILRGQVILLRNGKTFILNFPLGSEVEPIVTVSEDKRIINRNAVSKKVPDLNAAFKQVVPIPFIESGKIIGIKVTNIKDKSLAMKAGIKEGDVIISINDRNIGSMRNALKIIQEMRGQEKFDIVVKRGNDIKNLIYYLN